MQYAVPQFTDVEDKLIGPFTLKQFLIVMAAGGIDLFFWSIFKISFIFFILALPVSIIGLGLTFGQYNGRKVYSYTGAFIGFVSRPQVRIFRREEPTVFVQKKEAAPKGRASLSEAEREPTESRLKKLAYLLDQKTAEEKELIRE